MKQRIQFWSTTSYYHYWAALCNQRTFYEDILQLSQALLSHKHFKIHFLKIVSVNYKRKYLEGRNWCWQMLFLKLFLKFCNDFERELRNFINFLKTTSWWIQPTNKDIVFSFWNYFSLMPLHHCIFHKYFFNALWTNQAYT